MKLASWCVYVCVRLRETERERDGERESERVRGGTNVPLVQINAGINVRKGTITNILDENVVQPLLVSTSAISLATECVRMMLKIDDIVVTR